jgi:hypothetical protein
VIIPVWGPRLQVNFSLIGTVSGVVSSLFVSLNSIYTKKVGCAHNLYSEILDMIIL